MEGINYLGSQLVCAIWILNDSAKRKVANFSPCLLPITFSVIPVFHDGESGNTQ